MILFAHVLLALVPGETPPLPRDELPSTFGLAAPKGLHPADHTPTTPDPARLALGRALFFDPVLSGDRTVSCASCHQPAHGFADPVPFSLGVRGQRTRVHTPSLFNRDLGEFFSWTGQSVTLHEQVLLPIHSRIEMDLGFEEIAPRLRADPRFGPAFESAFGRPATIADTGAALETFVSRIWIGASAVDRFQAGEFDALDERERAGLWLYESKAGCWRCHSGRNYTDEDFHTTGIGAVDGMAERGRFAITDDSTDRGRFKTPTLRGLLLTAPFMHDGSLASIEDVLAFYRRGGNATPERDEDLRPLELDEAEAANLAAFLRALSR